MELDPPATVSLGRSEDFAPPCLRTVRAGGRRLLVVATADGLTVTDNACPHEGYGLAQGDLSDGVLTCAWHNWKYRAADGHCLVGEEDLRTYPVEVVDGDVRVRLVDPPPARTRERLTASLRRGLEDGYVGQLSRDVVRLLRADADPVQVVWEAVAWGAPRAAFGFGHAMASLVDCLATAATCEGDARALPIVNALARVVDTERRRPLRPRPEPLRDLPADGRGSFGRALEGEDLVGAEAILRGALAAGATPDEVRPWLLDAVGRHHLSYGHGAIYVQKAFELCEVLGWERAPTVLPHLVPALGYGTREDRLPYMRRFVRALDDVDLGQLASAAPSPTAADAGPLRRALMARPATPGAAATAVAEAARLTTAAGIEALLDVVVGVGAHRLLHYDPQAEVTSDALDFGWLDLTHVLTYASAARWAWRHEPGPSTARLALWTAWLALYAGRTGYVEADDIDAAEAGDPLIGGAVPSDPAGLSQAVLADRSGVPIVSAHLVKTAHAAVVEAEITGSELPRLAAARFAGAPRRESFVALQVRKAIQLADGRVPD